MILHPPPFPISKHCTVYNELYSPTRMFRAPPEPMRCDKGLFVIILLPVMGDWNKHFSCSHRKMAEKLGLERGRMVSHHWWSWNPTCRLCSRSKTLWNRFNRLDGGGASYSFSRRGDSHCQHQPRKRLDLARSRCKVENWYQGNQLLHTLCVLLERCADVQLGLLYCLKTFNFSKKNFITLCDNPKETSWLNQSCKMSIFLHR